jgi:hypothetical protein
LSVTLCAEVTKEKVKYRRINNGGNPKAFKSSSRTFLNDSSNPGDILVETEVGKHA